MDQKIIGAFNYISFPEYGINSIRAKMDTGAYSGAIHSSNIRELKINGKQTLVFSPFDEPGYTIATTKYIKKHVKSSNGLSQVRFFVDTTIVIDDKPYLIHISLADRKDMRWPVLVGRKFLRDNYFLIDVNMKIPKVEAGRVE